MSGMGLLGGLFDSPENMGLLMAAASMAERSGPSTRPSSFGQVLSSGLLGAAQGYQGVQDSQFQREYRTAQMDQHKAKTAASKAQQEAIARVATGYQMDPNFKPSMGDLLAIDPDSAIKGMMPGTAVDFGLEPKVGINPETGKTGYFIQDKRGNTKWLGAEVPKNLQFVPGNDYTPPRVFDKRDGNLSPVPAGTALPQSPVGGPGGASLHGATASETPAIDPLAPWASIRSPKEMDDMRKQVFMQDNKRLDEIREAARKGRSIMTDLDKFGALNRQQATGSPLDAVSWLPTMDSDKREMEAIQSRLAPQLRVAGSGSDSDLEQRMRLKALPGIDKPGDVNKNIRLGYSDQLRDVENELAFKETYLAERGHLNGVEDLRSQAISNGKTGGLDLSKLTADQIAYLRQQDPDAVDRGVARLARNGGGQPAAPAQNKTLMAQLPTPNKSNQGKMAIDHETGKRYKSNGMQWVEVQ